VGASVTIALIITAAATVLLRRAGPNNPAPTQASPADKPVAAAPKPDQAESVAIQSGDTFAGVLVRAGLDKTATAAAVAAVEKNFDTRSFRAGTQLTLIRSGDGMLKQIEYSINPDRKLSVSHAAGSFESTVVEIPGIVQETPVCGTLEGSLFGSLEKLGERAELALQIAEIFAWDIDFYTDPQEGDKFCLVIEKKQYVNGQPPSYGRILSAKYDNAGSVYEAYLFPDADGRQSYFGRDGKSLRAAFLRSPLKLTARISSHFSRRRFHPVLRLHRPHFGTDYAVPRGTPVQAVAAGTVTFSGRSGGAGNLVRIQHAAGYETQYLHLSRRLVRQGQRVDQGQRIGLVGSTGLATGPHLDFRIARNGVFQDFEKLRAPRASNVSPSQRATFEGTRRQYAALMERTSSSVVASSAAGRAEEIVR
jgi:murein DD-endopeptidase MepM/ murein hydrolase activator NlpD